MVLVVNTLQQWILISVSVFSRRITCREIQPNQLSGSSMASAALMKLKLLQLLLVRALTKMSKLNWDYSLLVETVVFSNMMFMLHLN